MCDMPEELRTMFGFVIVDEAHKLVAPTFQLAVRHVAPAFFLGLSATPERGDGLHVAMPFLLGDIVHRICRPPSRDVNVFSVPWFYKKMKECKRTIQGRVVYSTAKMITEMSKYQPRQKCIVDILLWCMNENRTVLVLSDRVDLLKELINLMDEEAQKKCGLLTGKTKSVDRADAMSKQVILATYGLCREGFDKGVLDTLVMVTPVTNIEQCVGRILRGNELSNSPLVIDIVDKFSVFNQYAKKRRQYYQKNCFQITEKLPESFTV